MDFKKEFDFDKEFFNDNTKHFSKRKVAVNVFFAVFLLTAGLFVAYAIIFAQGAKLGASTKIQQEDNLKDAQEYFFEGVNFYNKGEYTRAVESFNKQLKLVDDPDTYDYLGKIYLEQEDINLAIEYFKKAVQYKADFFEPNYELGKIYFGLNDFNNSSHYLSSALKVQPDNTDLLSLTADSYRQTGKADDAIRLYKKCIELEPSSLYPKAALGKIYFLRSEYHNAITYYEDVLMFVFDETIALELAKCYLELNMPEKSLALADKILETDKENKQALSLKKMLQYKTGANETVQEQNIQNDEPAEELTPIDEITPINKEAAAQYIKEIEPLIKINWAPPLGSNLKKATVKFTVDKTGELKSNIINISSGLDNFDKSALDAVSNSAPFPPLPDNLNAETLDVILTLDYNVR